MFAMRSAAMAAAIFTAAVTAQAQESVHKLAIHVDQNDPAVMNLALNNAQNVKNHYEARGEKVEIEIVAYGPGLNMFVAAKSPVKERIAAMSLESPEITFSACENTLQGMIKKAGEEVPLVSEAAMVPSGVVRLMELQADGYAYVRP
ncbi:DsrE family protein [Mesorhizobium xinjiangense]|uniref:DsrE family protein n=1 Tax=Mesorhizobium xinjiangense TaxID=2678685 RepID=UPI0018DE9FD1|nr:DsrE family protein [Mesorhizobium xinjiangense]